MTAITGKSAEKDYLLGLGAKDILLRNEIELFDNKPLLKPIFAGAIDTVGGVVLENIIKSTKPIGVITYCGNAASAKLDLTVFPFILRGVSLMGIDSQNYPLSRRKKVWNKLASEWKPGSLMSTFVEINLEELNNKISLMLEGKLKGRTIIKIGK